MIDQNAVIRYAQSYRDTWLDSGEPDELGAIVDAVRQYTATLPAVFVAATPLPSFEEAKTTAAKALNAATWTNAHAVDAGVLFEKGIKTFATSPEYIIAPLNSIVYAVYINAAWIVNAKETEYQEMTGRASAELAKWNQAADDPLALLNLRMNTANRLSYELTDLALSEDQRTIRTLMQKMGI